MKHKIELLKKEIWQNYEANFSDFANNCYGIEILHEKDTFSVLMRKMPLNEPKIIRYPQKLFASNDITIKAWGIIENDQPGIETSVENSKSPRLYVSLLWVDEKYRRQGIASALVDKAKLRAREENIRAIYLQTWSCNEHAIAFYISQGFKLIGFDSCPFSNDDIEKFNVPLKLGYTF